MAAMLSLTGAGSAGSAAVLANDTFTDVVNTDLVSHTMSPVGQGWQENAAGGYLINNSNQAAAQGVAGYVSAQTQTNHSSVTVTADINFSGNTGNDLGLQLRYVDDSNFWALLIDMAAHHGGIRIGALALADGPSHLERRILAMNTPRKRHAIAYGGLSSMELCSLLLGQELGGEALIKAEHAARNIGNWRQNVHDGYVPATALELASALGANHTVAADGAQVDTVLELTDGVGADVVLDFVAEQGAEMDGWNMTRRAGSYYVIGYGGTLTIPTLDIISTERNIIGNIVGTYNDLVELMALAQAGKVTLHTRTYPLDAAPDAFADLDAGRVRGRAILVP